MNRCASLLVWIAPWVLTGCGEDSAGVTDAAPADVPGATDAPDAPDAPTAPALCEGYTLPAQQIPVQQPALVETSGLYSGLLPRGSYVFCGQPFEVQPGVAVRIEVSPKLKKTTGNIVNVQTTPTWGSGAEGVPAEPSPKRP